MRLKRVHIPTRNTAGRHFGRRAPRWRLIPVTTAAALALGGVAALAAHETTVTGGASLTRSASRAPAARGTGVVDPAVKPYLNPMLLSAVPVGPGAVSKPVQTVLTSAMVTTTLDSDGIPEVALEAYRHAAAVLALTDPGCHLPWQLVAAIGRVESDDGRFGGSMLLPNGNETRPIYGIPLDGRNGVALVRDTDGGKLDGDPNFDRAVGPMQFIPSTWADYGIDGNGDGKKDLNNIFDAALAAGDYLCAGGGDLANPAQEVAAVLRYNDADEYVRVVLALAASYEHGDAATVPAPVALPSSPHTEAPAPTRTPVRAPAPPPTPAFTPTAATPTVHPTPPTTEAPREDSTTTTAPAAPTTTTTTVPPTTTTTVPATTTTTETTGPAPAPSCQPGQAPVPSTESTTTTPPDSTTTAPACQPGQAPGPSPTRLFHKGQTANIGWAPAMRQVVVKLLSAPESGPTQPLRHTQPGPRPAEPVRREAAP